MIMKTLKFILLFMGILICKFSIAQTWQYYQDSAKSLVGTGQLKEAIPFFKESNRLLEKAEGKNADYAKNLEDLGRIYFTNDILHAEPYFLESKNIREKIFTRESREYANSANALGNLYSELGKFSLSEKYHLEALSIRERVGGKTDQQYGTSLNNLANLYRTTGRYDKAEEYALAAKIIREKARPDVYAITLTNLANLYRDIGQYETAEQFYIQAREIRRKLIPVGESDDYMASTSILGDLYAFMGKNTEAESLYLEVRALYQKAERMNEYAQTLNSLSVLYRSAKRLKEAETLGLEAKKIWQSIFLPAEPRHPNLAFNYNNLGGLYAALGKYEKAKTFYLKAGKIWSARSPDQMQNSMELARVYWNLKQSKMASDMYAAVFNQQYDQLKKIFAFTNESEKNLYLKNINGQGDEFYSFYYSRPAGVSPGMAYNIALSNRNLILSSIQELRKSVYQSGDTTLRNKFNQWAQYRRQLSSLYFATEPNQLKQKKILEEQADLLEKDLSRNTIFKNASKPKVKWKDVQSRLKPNEAAIEFVEFQYFNGKRFTDSTYYIALLLKKNFTEPIMINLCERKRIDSLWNESDAGKNVADLYLGRGAGDEDDYISSADVYGLVWQPIEKHLSGISKIYYSSAGLLHRISFAAIPIGKSQLLSDKYQLSELGTTASLMEHNETYISGKDNFKLYGGVKYGAGFDSLPGTKEEVLMVENNARAAKFKVATYTGENATEESFKKRESDPPEVLHVATHGFFFPPQKDPGQSMKKSGAAFRSQDDPLLRSGLIFAGANNSPNAKHIDGVDDGILTAYEISNMYFPNTKLVVLSACETALGDVHGSEGVYGLQRAFKMAGAENLIMSLWQVPDMETAEFMKEFYKNIFLRRSVADAFFRAQSQMKNKYRNDPYKWAAWILVR